MYLWQRLIGVGVYTICLLCTCFLLRRVKGIKGTLNLYILVLGLMGFFFVPHSGADLTRAYPALHLYTQKTVKELFDAIASTSSPMVPIYYRLIGKLGDDRLLPCITAIITYGFIFGIIKSYNKNTPLQKRIISVSVLFFMSRGLLMATISNIRSMLSLSIIAFCIYKIMFESRSFLKYLFIIVIASLIHVSGMAASLLFFLYYYVLGSKVRNRFLNIIEGLVLIVGVIVFGRFYILDGINKGISYLSFARDRTGYFYVWEMLLSLIIVMFTLNETWRYLRIIKRQESENKISNNNEIRFIFLFSVIDLLLLFIEFNIGQRLSYLVAILDIPLIFRLMNDDAYMPVTKTKLSKRIVMVSFLMLIIACSRGDLCSLKFHA